MIEEATLYSSIRYVLSFLAAFGALYGTPTLKITSGSASVTITDGDDGSLDGGVFASNIVLGKFRVGGMSATEPMLPMSTQSTSFFGVQQIGSAVGDSSVTFDFSWDGYSMQVSGFDQDIALNPNVDGTNIRSSLDDGTAEVVYHQYINGVLVHTVSAGPSTKSPARSLTETYSASPAAPYSLRQVITLTFRNASPLDFASFAAQLTPVPIPEPGSALMLGTILLGGAALLRGKPSA